MSTGGFPITFTFLGSGSSESFTPLAIDAIPGYKAMLESNAHDAFRVPHPSGSQDPKNCRLNSSLLVEVEKPNSASSKVLIDAGMTLPVLLAQGHNKLLEGIDLVLLTHGHSDAMGGLAVLDGFLAHLPCYKNRRVKVISDTKTYNEASRMFDVKSFKILDYVTTPKVELEHPPHPDVPASFQHDGVTIQPLWAEHNGYALGFLIEHKLFYLSDYARLCDSSLQFFEREYHQKKNRLEVAVLDLLAPLFLPHKSHQTLLDFTKQAAEIKARVTFATQSASNAVPHAELNAVFLKIQDKASTPADHEKFGKFEEDWKSRNSNVDAPLRDALLWTGQHLDSNSNLLKSIQADDLMKYVSPHAYGLDLRQAYDGMRWQITHNGPRALSDLPFHQSLALHTPPPLPSTQTVSQPSKPVAITATLLGSASPGSFYRAAAMNSKTLPGNASLLLSFHKGQEQEKVLVDVGWTLPSLIYQGHLGMLRGVKTIIITQATPDAHNGLMFLHGLLRYPGWDQHSIDLWAESSTLKQLCTAYFFLSEDKGWHLRELHPLQKDSKVESHPKPLGVGIIPIRLDNDHIAIAVDKSVLYTSHWNLTHDHIADRYNISPLAVKLIAKAFLAGVVVRLFPRARRVTGAGLPPLADGHFALVIQSFPGKIDRPDDAAKRFLAEAVSVLQPQVFVVMNYDARNLRLRLIRLKTPGTQLEVGHDMLQIKAASA